MSSSRLRRAASVDRLSSRRDFDLSCGSNCDLTGFPYCCTKHYNSYRRWPYYLDPADYPLYHGRYSQRYRYWPDWSYYTNGDYYLRKPWYYYDDDYYGDYLRGYAEGVRKFDEQRKRSSADPLVGSSYADKYPSWWYYKPFYYRRYLY